MARRTKQQIEDEKRLILENKKTALAEVNKHLNYAAQLSEEDVKKIGGFLYLFLQCEMVYKTLYPEMKRIQEKQDIDVRQLKFNIQKLEAALRAFGISYDHEKIKIMFSANKSYLIYRNEIMHGFKENSVNAVIANYDEIESTLKEFLVNVGSGDPALS